MTAREPPRRETPPPGTAPSPGAVEVATELEVAESAPGVGTPQGQAWLIVRAGDGAARVIDLADGDVASVGRAPESTVCVDDPRVSRNHARVARQGHTVALVDLGSRNGTSVNGAVVRGAERALAGGDVVRVGPAEIVVAIAAPPPAEAPPGIASADGLDGEGAPLGAGFIVADEAMVKVFQVVQRLARAQTTVLVLGETGAGKEVVSEQIHRASPRAGGPFVRLSCAALPEALLESELFGHEKAAFTGADRRKIGYFEAAQGGTLLLDEIGELPLAMQAKLLRVLESRRVARIGGTQEIELDVRVVCATHRDLQAEVAAGRFRQDLFYRISTFVLRVPPLRERRAEIALLAHRFAQQVAGRMGEPSPRFAPAATQVLEAHAWPGNLRELRNAVEHAVVLAEGGVIEVEHLPASVVEGAEGAAPPASAGAPPPSAGAPPGAGEPPRSTDGGTMPARLAELEKKSIEDALAAEGNNQTRAAKRLGISRRALLYKLDKYDIRR
ncbi:sigma 54-interacting transcriptional regulator [Sorangium sp. So ce375]|uniref:sigma 54-interacting transcriptional regulator n=1 Tax=Sorangium sp. So ce375 TaxID=3133306 RepID=UPI003F5C1781